MKAFKIDFLCERVEYIPEYNHFNVRFSPVRESYEKHGLWVGVADPVLHIQEPSFGKEPSLYKVGKSYKFDIGKSE